jgi:enterochelin esterase family protein
MALLQPVPAIAQQAPVDGVASAPEFSARVKRIETGDPARLEDFWRMVEETGTPLVEPDSANPVFSIVTFVARGGAAVDRMRVESNLTALLTGESFALPDDLGWMKRIADTDVWYLSLRVRNDLRVPYRLATVSADGESTIDVDPYNPKVWEPGVDALRASILELSEAPAQPWRNPSGDEGEGDWDELTDDETGRSVYVYKPVGWTAERPQPYPLLVGLGAFGHGIGMRVDRMVDTLIATGELPTMVVALVDLSGGDEATRYEATGDFILDELLPYLRTRYNVTSEPGDVVVSGTSRRGMVAALLAFEHPDVFGNVLSLSGSYYWHPDDVPEFEWLPRRYAFAERRPVRLYLAAGELETFVTPGNHGHYLVATNRHMRDVLVARGYDLEYVEFNGVHSELNWQDWLAAGLEHFLRR